MADLIGHRGWPARFPDNTLTGFVAVSALADAVEADIRRTRDGKLVLSHDPILAGHVVADTAWAELAETDVGGGHHPTLLDEVIAALPDTPMHLEIKNHPWEQGFEPDHRLALEAAERSRPRDTVTSFNPATIEAVRRVFPDVRTGLAMDTFSNLDEAVARCRSAGHVALVPAESLLRSPPGVDLEVYPWTVNSRERAVELAHWGVSGIITDDAQAIGEALKDTR